VRRDQEGLFHPNVPIANHKITAAQATHRRVRFVLDLNALITNMAIGQTRSF